MLLSILLLFCLAFALAIAWEWKQRNIKSDIPLPPAIGLLELSPKAGENMDAVFQRLKAKHGQIVRFRIPFFAHFVVGIGPAASKTYHMMKNEEANIMYGYRVSSRFSRRISLFGSEFELVLNCFNSNSIAYNDP